MTEASAPTTWVVVPIPEADPLVRAAWRRFSPEAPFGTMPEHIVVAHVTVAGPFLPPDRVDLDVVSEIREYCARRSAFRFTLGSTATFSTGVVYLVPEPAAPFLELMRWFADRWPEAPLYGGAYPALPHVSLAVEQRTAEQVAGVVSVVQPALPLNAVARELRLVLTEQRMWYPLHSFPFGLKSSTGVADVVGTHTTIGDQ